MDILAASVDGVAVVRLAGRFDPDVVADLEGQLRAHTEGAERMAVLDFTDVDYINSSGLRVLVTLAKRAKVADRRFAIAGINGVIRRIFDISGFTTILAVHDDLPTAMAALRGET